MNQHLILYDGICGLCNRLNRFIIKWDKRQLFLFASLQSELGEELLRKYGKDPKRLDTFYIVTDYEQQNEALLDKAEASLFVTKQLGFPWRIAGVFRIVPLRWLDKVYDYTARNRYKYFGKYEMCPLPLEGQRDRFIDFLPEE